MARLSFTKRAARFLRRKMSPGTGHTPGREQDASYYDATFEKAEHWREHYTKSRYYPLWTVISDRMYRHQFKAVIDIGCGPGQFALLLHDIGIPHYLGLDFSGARIRQARQVCPDYTFAEVDVYATDILESHDYDAIVCMEFLEHVERDREVIERLRPGVRFFGTVPNFTDPAHVRHFKNTDEVAVRYAEHFDDFSVREILANTKGKAYFIIEGVVRGASRA